MDLLKSIEIFREVCKQMSFSQAANTLNLVPSAVSRQVNELEKHLGVRLLQRTTRSISLTEEGKRYLRKMEMISQNVSELMDLARDDEHVEDHIYFTAPPILVDDAMMAVINEYLIRFPNVSLSLSLVNREINLVEEGYDLALRVGALENSNLISRKVGQFSISVVASPQYLAHHGRPLHPKDLASHDCIINTLVSSPHRWNFVENKRKFSVKIRGRVEVNSDAILRTYACAGLGIAYLPSLIVQDKITKGELQPILEEYLSGTAPVSLIYPSQQYLSVAKRKLIDCLVQHFEYTSS